MGKRFDVILTPEEEHICRETRRTFNLDIFSRHFFKLEKSGSRWMPFQDDRIGHYQHLFQPEQVYDAWQRAGEPEHELDVTVGGVTYELVVDWNGENPEFLLPHGFMFHNWVKPVVAYDTDVALAITGTGTTKTSSVAIAALTYCALFPGFSFMNLAPSEKQARLILDELDKWAAEGSPYHKFVRPTIRGELYIKKPYALAEIVSPFGPAYTSTFACQTVGEAGQAYTGSNTDWTNADEGQYLKDVHELIPIIVTRSRATRPNGDLRLTKFSIVTNPGENPSLGLVKENIIQIQNDPDSKLKAVYIDGVFSDVNLYMTKKQRAYHRETMDATDQKRWLEGDPETAQFTGELSPKLITGNVDPIMDDEIRKQGLHKMVSRSGMGVISYEMPYEEDHFYLVTGDPGKNNAIKKTYNNVPIVTVFDVTNFPAEPTKMVKLAMLDGMGKYTNWLEEFKRAMITYRAPGYYDATNLGITGAEDFGAFDGGQMTLADGKVINLKNAFNTTPITFANNNKRWARSVFTMIAQDGMFAWPTIESLIFQASIYAESGPGVKKLADDILASIFVFCMALRFDGTLWNKFVQKYHIDYEVVGNVQEDEFEGAYYTGRRARGVSSRRARGHR